MASLPEELLVDILSRLPVESLVRFKCVCKSWYALFNNPDFVSKHMKNQSDGGAILLKYWPGRGNLFTFFSSVDDGGYHVFCLEDLEMYLNSELPYNEYGHVLQMHGHWNGIVALSYFQEYIILCNPAIREFRMLPKSCFHPFPTYSCDYATPEPSEILIAHPIGVGFGYDPKTDDCKLVRVVGYWDDENKLGMLPSKAEVFSMRYDSMWRAISTADIRVYIWAGSGYERFFDGVYYWQGYDTSRMNELVLLSFDMAEEVFSKTPLPEICEYRYVPGRPLNLVRTHLGVFNNESIALFVYMICGHEPCFEVWVMKEIDGKESWIKQLTIGPVPRIQMPLLFWKNCKELLHEDANGRIFSSNLVTLENIEIRIERGVVFTRPATDYYRKTLVSVKAREGRTLQLDK